MIKWSRRLLPLLLVTTQGSLGCEEPSQSPAEGYGGEDQPILCRDGKDNDGDGRVDCDDPDCRSVYVCAVDTDSGIDPSGDSIIWVKPSSATIQMGSNNGDPSESPQHVVYVVSYEIMRTEVTVAQYWACVEEGGCEDNNPADDCASDEYLIAIMEEPERYPMMCLSWHQATAFCEWVGGRLPSEAEWEHMARNGINNDDYPWGEGPPSCDLSVIDDGEAEGAGCGLGHPWPVCSKEEGNSSRFDTCDIIGNVQEWVEDDVHRDYTGAPGNREPWIEDPRTEGRVVRGGAYFDGPELTATTRRFCDPADGCDISDEMDGFGVRCAR